MWIKKTSVKTTKKTYDYIQLVQSKIVNGRAVHHVIANLGRAENVDMEKATALVEAVSTGISDAIPLQEIELLSTQSYGVNLLLKNISSKLHFSRFFTDLAHYYKKEPSESMYAVYALLTYYIVMEKKQSLFYSFLHSYYIPNAASIDQERVYQAMLLFAADSNAFKEILQQKEKPEERLNYIYELKDNMRNDEIAAVITVTTSYQPVDFFMVQREKAIEKVSQWADAESTWLISDYKPVLESFSSRNDRDKRYAYIFNIQKENLSAFFQEPECVLELWDAGGYFDEFADIGYRAFSFEGKSILILRPENGDAPAIDESYMEPRECIISNVSADAKVLLERYFRMENYQSYCYSVFLPKDLSYLKEKMSEEDLTNALLNIQFFKFLFLNYLGNAVETLNMTASDAISICEEIVTVKLPDEVSHKRFHSEFTAEQEMIFEAIGMTPHPRATLS